MSETNKNNIPEEPRKAAPGEGIRSMKSTWAFRAINFELYAKPSELMNSLNSVSQFHINSSFRYCDNGHRISLDHFRLRIHRLDEKSIRRPRVLQRREE